LHAPAPARPVGADAAADAGGRIQMPSRASAITNQTAPPKPPGRRIARIGDARNAKSGNIRKTTDQLSGLVKEFKTTSSIGTYGRMKGSPCVEAGSMSDAKRAPKATASK